MKITLASIAALVAMAIGQTTLTVKPLIAAKRRIDWTHVGATIPTGRTQCGSTINAGAGLAGTINTAIQGCANGTYVKLGPGSFTGLTGIDWAGTNGVTLRGSGADSTLLFFTNDVGCGGQIAAICIRATNLSYYGPGPPTNQVNWTAGYTQGTKVVTVSSTPGLSVGMPIELDQESDAGDTGDLTVCGEVYMSVGVGCVQQGSLPNSRTNRAQRHVALVVSCSPACPNAVSTAVTIDRPLHMPNWGRSGKTPAAYWGSNGTYTHDNGIEDLSADFSGVGGTAFRHVITILFGYNNWVKGVRTIICPTPKTCINLYDSHWNTIQDVYMYGSDNYTIGSTTYGVEMYGSSDNLVINSIGQHRTSPFVRDGGSGNVVAYNFATDDYYGQSPTFQQQDHYSHEQGNGMILDEGNDGIAGKGDVIHGTSNLFTYFRNHFVGHESGRVQETSPVIIYPFSRYYNFVGNVLGDSSYHNTYSAASATAIYNLTSSYAGQSGPTIPTDAKVASTMYRWGNWDTVTNGVKWDSSEVPTADSYAPQTVPGTHNLPRSLYLSSKPTWWPSGIPWPGIGPDITCTSSPTNYCVSDTGTHVNKNPARVCWESLGDDLNYPLDASGLRPKHYSNANGKCPWLN